MSQLRYPHVPPPKRRAVVSTSRTTETLSYDVNTDSGGMRRFLDLDSMTRDANQYGQRQLSENWAGSAQFDRALNYTSCLKHGRLHANLCERCIGMMVSRGPRVQQLSIESGARILSDFLYKTYNLINSVVTSPISVVVLKAAWTAIKLLAQIASACFVCFFMMWFISPSMSPADRRRKEMDDLRRKAADDEWRRKRDRDHAERQSEKAAWEKQRDDDFRKAQREQADWEAQRDIAWREKRAADAAWIREQDDIRRKADDEYQARLKQEDDRRARVTIDRETNALIEKIAHSKVDKESDLLKLAELRVENQQLEPAARGDEKAVEKAIENISERFEKDGREEREKADALWSFMHRDPAAVNQSDLVSVRKLDERADEKEDDWNSTKKFTHR